MRSTRRNSFKTVGTGAAGLTIGSALPAAGVPAASGAPTHDDGPALLVGEHIAVAETTAAQAVREDGRVARAVPEGR